MWHDVDQYVENMLNPLAISYINLEEIDIGPNQDVNPLRTSEYVMEVFDTLMLNVINFVFQASFVHLALKLFF